MATIEVTGILKALQAERANALAAVAKIDKAIESLRELSSENSTSFANGRVRKLSAAARRRIAAAQKARWAKFRKEQKKKE